MQRRVRCASMLGLAILSAVVTVAQTTRELFPHTTDVGRAAAKYEDDTLQVVAAYYYSQRHHDSRWLLVELAVTSRHTLRIGRDDITLVTPGGRTVPVASQRAFSQDRARILLLRQSATTTRHPVVSYLKGPFGRIQWFVASAAEGTVKGIVDISQHAGARGDLYFASPTGAWEEGTYSLRIDTPDGSAMLPIDLD